MSPEFIQSLGDIILNSITRSEALGRSQIVDKDHFFSRRKKSAAARIAVGKYFATAIGLNWVTASDESIRISFDLIPEDALQYLREKAFTIAGVANQDFLNEVQRALESALRDGKSYKEFASDVRSIIDKLGYSGDSPLRLNTIFRTNIYSAYTIGQLSQVDQMRDRFPSWRYVAVMDDRTRPLHRYLNDQIFLTGEGPMPPIDYGCRCTAQFIHIYDDNADLQVMPDETLQKMLEEEKVIPFNNQSDFEQWSDQKEAVMDARIKSVIFGLM